MKITVEMDIKEFEDYLLFKNRTDEENKITYCKIMKILKDLNTDNPDNADVKAITKIIQEGLSK